ncbi:hypothetical protein [Nocardia sp. CA-290969]|uniref:hypothetical protein n=1 Tax=Nocardia sp. CA-290969 TaxID=3239986 RepID=UPI003D922629
MENRKCSELFDAGSKALWYFRKLEEQYLRWVGDGKPPGFKSYDELHALFYRLNGLNEDAFRNSAGALKVVLEKVTPERNRQMTFSQTIPTVWWGEAAAGASAMMATQLQLSEADIAIVRKVHEEMDPTPQALRDALAIIATAADGISTSEDVKVDNSKTPEDVKDIITFVRGEYGSTSSLFGSDSLIDRVNRAFPDYQVKTLFATPSDVSGKSTNTSGLGKLKWECERWLNAIFKTEYESNITEFVDACNEANQKIGAVYDELVKAFENLNATKYPCPDVSQAPQTTSPAGTPTGTGAPTTPGAPSTPGTPATTTAPSTTTPPSTTTASTDNPLSTIAALGTQLASSGLGTQVTEGLNSLVSSATQQITSTLEQLREQAENVLDPDGDEEPGKDLDGDGKPDQDADGDGEPDKDLDGDGKPDTDADGDGEPDPENDKGVEFNGQNYKLEVGPDGQLKLVVDSPNGEPVTYQVEIGPDGKPSIVGDAPVGEAPPGTENQQPAGQPAGVPGAPAGKPEEDGEHQPQNYPPPQQPEDETAESEPPAAPPPGPPVDTGAQLAEAGPL